MTKIDFEVKHKNLYLALGILGALILLFGNYQTHPQLYYIIGSFILMLIAIHFKLVYFIALEFILAAGHAAKLLGVGPYTELALPLLLCFQLYIFYLMVGRENKIIVLIGIIGIAFVSLGLAYENQWIFFSGSLFVSIYAYYIGYKGRYASYIWGVLNTIFALRALYKIFL